MGKHIRAVADNQELAKIRVLIQIDALICMVHRFLSCQRHIPWYNRRCPFEYGLQQIVMILSVTVLGGLGGIYGVMLAGLFLGFAMGWPLFVSQIIEQQLRLE